jgi:uncharacterized protein YheU (UPF0270 family)
MNENSWEGQQGVMEVPYEKLSEEALLGLIEAFVSREGTDYGELEMSFEEKCQQVLSLFKTKQSVVLFSPEDETFQIVLKKEWQAMVK